MTAINEDPSEDIQIDWPAEPGLARRPDPIGLAADRRSLLVIDRVADGRRCHRVPTRPAARSVAGSSGPMPVVLGGLAGHDLDVRVSPDERWALTVDRVKTVRLVELATGRTWAVDGDRTLEWWPNGTSDGARRYLDDLGTR